MKKIDIQVVSNRPEFLARCVKSFFSSGLDNIGTMSIAAQGESIEMCEELESERTGSKIHWIGIRQDLYPSMIDLRRMANSFHYRENWQGARDALWGVFDDDHQFKDGAVDFFSECHETFKRIEGETGRYPYMSLAGGLGSYPSNGSLVVPPYCLFATGHGILFSRRITFPYYNEILFGGGEDKLMCAYAIDTRNAIPLKRWLSPVKRWNRPAATRKDSIIHDPNIWQFNTYEMIRRISCDADWRTELSEWDSKKHGAGKAGEAPRDWARWAKLFSKYTDKGKTITREISERVRDETGF